MEEISLFMSICWPSSRTHIPHFGKRGVTWFCWYQSQVSYMSYIQSGHIYDNNPWNYLSKQSFDPPQTPYLYKQSSKTLEPLPWCDFSIYIVIVPTLPLPDHVWLDCYYSGIRLMIDILRIWPDYLDEEE